ncbi:hypothetical protein FIBSPDRAFT_743775 [Athelia psychrophila]|uniref:PQ-loop-domain-containing protein n=1 Tax=Athelia psychrophila TaxID=1759441 RepID=A0A166I7K6_9AGAM|nr:hypothetical protein FIBSPDRAFT_743775 [Fibularhizoctonia sp. CBS 109695]
MDSLSEFAGYLSIATWLGAQFPQVYKNYKAQSSDGLALPFLANWLAGDVSNLIGCLLTHQLPFQTWLAMYFSFVDMMLLSQYWYYSSRKPVAPSHAHPRVRATSTISYRSLSAAAAHVAANAALAAQLEPQEPRARPFGRAADQSADMSRTRLSRDATEDGSEDGDLAAMADSFLSEGGRGTGRRKLVSWSSERQGSGRAERPPPANSIHPSLHITASLDRGRSRQREGEPGEEAVVEQTGHTRTSSRASRRGAGLVFLGVWALFGIGTLAGKRDLMASGAGIGKVLTDRLPADAHPVWAALSGDIGAPSTQRILGRFFAWLCTTLYLTSRLPQIWKNFTRKSVAGLSVYLFIFAFLGNFFYVISILTAPDMRASIELREAHIRESVPYLLGSGGTLMFDITIACQCWVYAPKPKRRGHQGSVRGRTAHEEEAGLLSEDAADAPSNT